MSKIPHQVFDMILKHVGENCQPNEIFTKDQLDTWAKENGFVKPEAEATDETDSEA